MIKANTIKQKTHTHTQKGSLARRKLCTCSKAAAAVFSHAVRREGTAETVGMFNKWQKSTGPVESEPISAQRRGSRGLWNGDTSLATGFRQSQGRTTPTGTNLCSRSLGLSSFSERKKKKEKRKNKNFFLFSPRYEVH